MVRSADPSGVTVKGRATNIVIDTATPGIRISNISDRGTAYLGTQSRVQVEFVMMSTKLVFVASILSRDQNSVLVSLPTSVVSIERRKNARYACTEDMAAYIGLSMWKPQLDDLGAPPFFPHYADVAAMLSVADVSFGGMCAVTRFPAVTSTLKRGFIDDKAKLILPMQEPIEVSVEVRWTKRIKEHVKDTPEEQMMIRSYRFGIEFKNQTDEVRLRVRQFIQQLSQAGAI